MDSSWVDEWKNTASSVKAAWIMFFLLELLIVGLVFWFSDNYLIKFALVVVTIIFGFIWLVVMLSVKVYVRRFDDSVICVYSGAFTNVLLIDNQEYDRGGMMNENLYGQLPNGTPVTATWSFFSFGPRIIFGT